jgi:hypothetical protein
MSSHAIKRGFSIWSGSKEAIDALEDIHFIENEKARISKSQVKAVFFDVRGIIMIDKVPEGQTANQKYYLEALTKLRQQVRKKRLVLWKKR